MNTHHTLFDTLRLEVPVHPDFFWPAQTLADFPLCCGPGRNGGLGDRLVPDRSCGLVWSPACWVHDFMWGAYPRSTDVFWYSNSVFYRNLLAIVAAEGNRLPAHQLRVATAVAGRYYDAVCTAGAVWYFAEL
ncbi:MAG: hypothetical protein KA768_03585 [Desulfobulbus sp.]|nr:hypothetical protein [Desulfobulbus sp.]